MQETGDRTLGWEDPLEKGMATQSNILAWRTPRTEELGGLQSMESKRGGHEWVTNSFTSMLLAMKRVPVIELGNSSIWVCFFVPDVFHTYSLSCFWYESPLTFSSKWGILKTKKRLLGRGNVFKWPLCVVMPRRLNIYGGNTIRWNWQNRLNVAYSGFLKIVVKKTLH